MCVCVAIEHFLAVAVIKYVHYLYCVYNQRFRIDVWHTLRQARYSLGAIPCIHNKSFATGFDGRPRWPIVRCSVCYSCVCVCVPTRHLQRHEKQHRKTSARACASLTIADCRTLPPFTLLFVLELDCDRTRLVASVWHNTAMAVYRSD